MYIYIYIYIYMYIYIYVYIYIHIERLNFFELSSTAIRHGEPRVNPIHSLGLLVTNSNAVNDAVKPS